MSSKETTGGIPLSHAPDNLGYKLLELPPELVALLESDAPPLMTLRPSTTAALLEAGGKTYSLRQKKTSNGLVLLALGDAEERPNDDGGAGTEGQGCAVTREKKVVTPRAGLRVIATVHETVELVPETDGSAAPQVSTRGRWHERFGSKR